MRLELVAVRLVFCSVRALTPAAESVTVWLRLELVAVRLVFCSVRAWILVADSVMV